jgi:hypothetical protein
MPKKEKKEKKDPNAPKMTLKQKKDLKRKEELAKNTKKPNVVPDKKA